jgi:hypothetical protein
MLNYKIYSAFIYIGFLKKDVNMHSLLKKWQKNTFLEWIFSQILTWIVCFGHWATEKAKKGEKKSVWCTPCSN